MSSDFDGIEAAVADLEKHADATSLLLGELEEMYHGHPDLYDHAQARGTAMARDMIVRRFPGTILPPPTAIIFERAFSRLLFLFTDSADYTDSLGEDDFIYVLGLCDKYIDEMAEKRGDYTTGHTTTQAFARDFDDLVLGICAGELDIREHKSSLLGLNSTRRFWTLVGVMLGPSIPDEE